MSKSQDRRIALQREGASMTISEELLKPCPFCGGPAGIEQSGTMRRSMIVACGDCGCRVESGDVVGMTDPASYHWNRRANDAPIVRGELRQDLVTIDHDVATKDALIRDPDFMWAYVQQLRADAGQSPYLHEHGDCAAGP